MQTPARSIPQPVQLQLEVSPRLSLITPPRWQRRGQSADPKKFAPAGLAKGSAALLPSPALSDGRIAQPQAHFALTLTRVCGIIEWQAPASRRPSCAPS